MKKEQRTYLKAAINILTAIAAFLVCILILPRIIVFFMPFIIGWLISLVATPFVRFFEERIKIKRKAGTAFVIILVLALVVLVIYAVGYFVVQELIKFVKDFPSLWASIGAEINMAGNNLDKYLSGLPEDVRGNIYNVTEYVKEYMSGLYTNDGSSGEAISAVGDFVNSIPNVIMGIVMVLLSSYFFVSEKEYITEFGAKYVPGAIRYRWDMIKRSVKSAFGGYFKAQIKIEVWIYIITAIGLLILKVQYAFLIALGISFLDFLPVFGAGTAMVPWALIKLIDGNYGMAAGILVVWGIGQIIRQIIQPKIVGDSIGIAPIPTLFLLYCGFRFGGVFGMIIAVPIGIIVINLYEEGVFKTTVDSFTILFAGFNNFRKIRNEDISVVSEYNNELPENYRKKTRESNGDKEDK